MGNILPSASASAGSFRCPEPLAGAELPIINPPLREEKDNQQLCQALVDGVIDSMAPDHTPPP